MGMDARKVYDEAIVIDGLSISNWESDAVFQRLRAGNITAINATVATWENFQQTMAHLAGWMRRFRERQDILQVKETADIHTAKKLGKTGIILGFQNASPIENELDRLGLFLALGVRIIQLTYHETNLLGSGCWERFDSGLSNFGVPTIHLHVDCFRLVLGGSECPLTSRHYIVHLEPPALRRVLFNKLQSLW